MVDCFEIDLKNYKESKDKHIKFNYNGKMLNLFGINQDDIEQEKKYKILPYEFSKLVNKNFYFKIKEVAAISLLKFDFDDKLTV